MGTFFAKKEDYADKKWQVIDARGQVVGRLAARIARILAGKDRTDYTPHTETGRGVIVVNAAEVVVTGNKAKDKIYKRYSGYPSGQTEETFEQVMKKDSTYPLKHAVKGMLPRSPLGYRMITRLLVYPGSEHPHQAQVPVKTSKIKMVKEKKS